MKKKVHLFIVGDVIGVGFRSWIWRHAQRMGLTGWVKNAAFKTVEAVFEGEAEKVDQMVEKCRQGPEASWVERVEVKAEEPKGEFTGFEIKKN